jgi:hypothetical protein
MEISDQIIKVLDDLSARFGIAIDWASENVIPKLEKVGERFIRYTAIMDVIKIVICLLAVAICLKVLLASIEVAKLDLSRTKNMEDYDYDPDVRSTIGCALGGFGLVISLVCTLTVGVQSINSLIRCIVCPELEIIQALSTYIGG